MDDYTSYDAIDLASLVRGRAVTPLELLQAACRQRDEVNPALNAVVVDFDPPISRDVPDAPFAGVPFLLKDLGHDLAGYPTSDGSRAWATFPRPDTSTVVDRWLDAGLVVFGRTNASEFGATAVTEPLVHGPTRNPWNLDHTPGGSSGGAAAAVASGIIPCAAASDGGGSIRHPASACGLFGLKVSRGLIPQGPQVGERMGGMVTDGVVSRSVRDTAAMLDALAGTTPNSPYLTAGSGTPYAEDVGRHPGRLRIGMCTASAINPDPHPEAIAAARTTAELLSELGHEVVELDSLPFDDGAVARDFLVTWFSEAARLVAHAKAIAGAKDSQFEPDTLVMAALGRAANTVDVLQAIENRQLHTRRLAEFHRTHDLLLTPTTAQPPPRIGEFELPRAVRVVRDSLVRLRGGGLLRFTPIVDQAITNHLGWVPYTQIANLTGRPAMSVPLHWTPEELPIGSHFVGPLGSEGMLLRLASQLEQARPWRNRRPPL